MLKLLASQAAISLENTRLYRDLQEREAKIRRLVDANIIGIFIWDFEGRIIEANEAFLRMVGYGRDDLVSGRMRWTELTPAEWRDADERRCGRAEGDRNLRNHSRRSTSGRTAAACRCWSAPRPSTEAQDQGVAFVLDLTERKRAEENLRESERRYREVQMELAHANRVATMGQLSASIAHEVNQPIAAAVTNARPACAGSALNRQIWRRSGRRSVVSSRTAIEPATSSTGSAPLSRRRRHGRSAWNQRGDP